MKDSKAWVRQWVTFMLTLYVISIGVIGFCVPDLFSVEKYIQVTGAAWGYIGWFFRARDIEKKQNALKDS